MIFLFFLTCAIVFVVLGLRERARYARESDLLGGRELNYMGAVLNVRRRWLESDRSLRARCLKALRMCDTGDAWRP